MRTSSPPQRRRAVTHALTINGHPVPYGNGVLPDDFARRLHLLKEATGLSWNGFAEALGVDPKQVLRWRHGSEPCGGAMLSLIRLAGRIPGGLELALGEDPYSIERGGR